MRLEVRIALSLLRPGRRHRFGDDPSQVAELHLPRGRGHRTRSPWCCTAATGRRTYGKLVTRPLCHDLARRGWAAWNLEYRRLGDGRGGGGGWPQTFDDVAHGIDALADQPGLDLSRVVLVGHSAGGQLALWAGRRPLLPTGAVGASPRVRACAVVGLAPVTDLRRARVHAEQLLGGSAEQQPERWAQADPARAGAPGVPRSSCTRPPTRPCRWRARGSTPPPRASSWSRPRAATATRSTRPVRRGRWRRAGWSSTARGHSPSLRPMRLSALLRRLLGRSGSQRVVSYAPRHDRRADPGEVVWTQVDFEDGGGSKDRPVLVVGRRDRQTVLALLLSTQEKRNGQPHWLAIGAGAWDRHNRPSYVRLDRVLELDADSIRRQGSVLDRARFEHVARALRAGYGWK